MLLYVCEDSPGVARRYNRRGLSHCGRSPGACAALSFWVVLCLVMPEESAHGSLWPRSPSTAIHRRDASALRTRERPLPGLRDCIEVFSATVNLSFAA